MTSAAAFASIAGRLGKTIPRLASQHDGEIIATVAAIGRTLAGAGLDWHDLPKRIAEPNLADMLSAPPPQSTQAAAAPPQPKREPSPWPTWSTLSHFGRLAMMDEIKEHGRFTDAEAEAFAAFHGAYYTQQCGATRKATILFNRACQDLWERGWRGEEMAPETSR